MNPHREFNKTPGYVPVKTETVPAPVVTVNHHEIKEVEARLLMEALHSLLASANNSRNLLVDVENNQMNRLRVRTLNQKISNLEELIRRFQTSLPATSPSCNVKDYGQIGDK